MKGERPLVQLHRAYLKAVVTGRVDLQRYLECLGPGGTGKGTFMRLAMALVGKRNTHSTTLKQLEENRFEAAAIFGKRLVLITDAERYGGEVSQLKAITGQDLIRYEHKNVQQGEDLVATCMVIVAANEAVQSADYTSGLERRRLTVPWVHQVKPNERRDLDTEFKPHLPGLLQWVLEMPDEEVTSLVRDTANTVRSLALWKAESLIETNPVAEWLDARIVHDPEAKTYVGVAKRDKLSDSPDTYLSSYKWLYPSYCEYSTATGRKATSLQRFSGLLRDLCVSQLKLEGVKKGGDVKGSYFEGLAIRQKGDTSPRIITDNNFSDNPPESGSSGNIRTSNPVNPDGNATNTDSNLMAENLVADGTDGLDGKIETQVPMELSDSLDDECLREQFHTVESPSGTVSIHQEPASTSDYQLDKDLWSDEEPAIPEVLLRQIAHPTSDRNMASVENDAFAPRPSQQPEPVPATRTKQALVFQVGDRCHYSVPKGAMAITCSGRELEVLNTRLDKRGEQEAEVKAPR